jgi:hypothetical protein
MVGELLEGVSVLWVNLNEFERREKFLGRRKARGATMGGRRLCGFVVEGWKSVGRWQARMWVYFEVLRIGYESVNDDGG